MSDNQLSEEDKALLTPVDGKTIFQVESNMRIRFNNDGWVEEIGRGGPDDPLGTLIQGKPGTKRDDIYARRFYDLFTRAVMLDIDPKIAGGAGDGCFGLILFKDLERGSRLYDRVSKIIKIANHLGLDVQPLS